MRPFTHELAAVAFGLPGRKLRRIPAGRPSADEALGKVPAGNIEMAEYAAQFSGGEQPPDRLSKALSTR